MAAEFDIIARYFAPLAGRAGLGLLDDAALMQPPQGHELVITTDAIVAGVHFFADDPASTIAQKALGVNLSDLAAKGAAPLGFLLSLILPDKTQEQWIADFSSGLGQLAKISSCPLIGGDTVFSDGPLALSITAFGSVPQGRMVKRGAAQAGDFLFVTGTIGDAAIGLREHDNNRRGLVSKLDDDHLTFLIDRYLRPQPRYAVADTVCRYVRASMDISDGFIGDLTKLVGLANLGADVFLEDVPHSVAARAAFRADPARLETALTGGDDYEILAAVSPENATYFQAECLAAGVAVSKVGTVTPTFGPVRFLDTDGVPRQFASPSYVHGKQ
jgi:thiamine-monophosphate kinase